MFTKKAWDPEVTDEEALAAVQKAARALKGTSTPVTEQNVARRAVGYPKSRGVTATLRIIRGLSDEDRLALGIGMAHSSASARGSVRPKVSTYRRYHRR